MSWVRCLLSKFERYPTLVREAVEGRGELELDGLDRAPSTVYSKIWNK